MDREGSVSRPPPGGYRRAARVPNGNAARLSGDGAPDLVRFTIVPEPDEAGTPWHSRGRPLGEADLGHERGRDPLDRGTSRNGAAERGGTAAEPGEGGEDGLERGRIAGGAHPAGIAQTAVLVIADQQPQRARRARHFGVAADDELRRLRAADREPVEGAAARIGA